MSNRAGTERSRFAMPQGGKPFLQKVTQTCDIYYAFSCVAFCFVGKTKGTEIQVVEVKSKNSEFKLRGPSTTPKTTNLMQCCAKHEMFNFH